LQKQDFSPTEAMIADQILQYGDSILDLSIQELAKATHTSTTTIMRFCKKVNRSGFKEFKHKFAQALSLERLKDGEIDDENYPFTAHDAECDIIDKIAQLTKYTINACQMMLDPKLIHRVVHEMIQAKSILAIGVSDSFLRLVDFQNKMLKINYYIKMSYLQPEQTFLCTHATQNDFALIVSFSGKTAEIVNEAKILRKRGVNAIALTANPSSPLAQLARTVILLPSKSNETTLPYCFSSQIAIEYVLNVIYSAVYRLNFEKNRRYMYKTKNMYLHK
jgi:DNA-binding MurR/RpiR family transcriptional regulator